eukprot:TRINITY_DN1126_c0_g1_i1.p1 TRINITY_DN1126_c0_g1~~TRINITY_DN1126_c0_g1_i1.p1  ORF type:complete len:263 (+),score=61.82 TRINITY_DN1126_c0_g1_i1:95-883(+)
MGSDFSSLTAMKNIGNGSTASVELVTDPQGGIYVMKTIQKGNKKVCPTNVQREIKAGQRLKNHPGIVAVTRSSEEKTCVKLLMDYVHGRNLKQITQQRNGRPMDEKTVKSIFEQVVDAVAFMHSKGVAHRDIKLENIMLSTDGKVKIIDFGMCQTMWSARCTDHVGSYQYCAPEVLDRKRNYNGYMADVWSLGVVLYALLFGQLPFSSSDFREMKTAQHLDLYIPSTKVSASAQNLLREMLQVDPLKRITMKNIALHDWLSY